ncbi:uncharacterized protein LOC108100294 isoform X2 [Drosophila ficusphila]|nr:uncharacterized protein LOC108100294 isoform X2 [Drosophila ficusphila]
MAPSVCELAAQGQSSQVAAPKAGGSNSSGTNKCGASSLNGSLASYKIGGSEQSWPQAPVYSKENQRPPVYNPEDYVHSLRKFIKASSSAKKLSIYDVSTGPSAKEEASRSATLPAKHSEYKSPIPAPPENDREMSLRQFGSITDLLTKLRADLRVSFPSFVQEFVGTPADGISHLLEVLRAIQMAQASNAPPPMPGASSSLALTRNPQSYQRRALLDELSCLQCISICCSRSLDAIARLGNTPVGLMPLASSATGQGIRARILALQLLASACDRQPFGGGSGGQKIASAGHTAVSDAMSTLRLRCSEPVRFRLLVGILNSGGGSGELQCAGVKFLNTFIESAVSTQQRLYIQAELFQAGLDVSTLARTISSSSPWLDALKIEVKRFNELHIDVDQMITQARDAERVRSQMVILERRVQILHEEKAVLTSMERRLQERCAELQREIFRLQGTQQQSKFKPVESASHQPVALPRQVPPPAKKQHSSEHEDEGISSSETGASLSPVPILVLPSKAKQSRKLAEEDEDDAATIEDVIEELDNIVSEAEKQISSQASSVSRTKTRHHRQSEKEIVPVNIVPQPPRKSRSLAHLVPRTDCSEQEGSDYGMLVLNQPGDPAAAERLAAMQSFFDEVDYDAPETDQPAAYQMESPTPDMPEANATATAYNASTNRELLDVIMNARHDEHDPTMQALRKSVQDTAPVVIPHHPPVKAKAPAPPPPTPPAQQFNGVFFMTGMNTPQKYPKPDISAALQARRVTKNVERLEAAFASAHPEALNDVAIGREKSRSNQQIYFTSNLAMRMHDHSGYGNPGNPGMAQGPTMRTRSHTQGSMSKVTDLPSGLY